ncbi:iron-sulfur cluster-binding protein [Alicyclobacillus sp. SO9]|nr:iron-sulfur cluster-binding protein [Alicyclobacillus sp. SO9]
MLDRSKLALQDDFLRTAVRFTQDKLRNKKRATTEEFGNWEEWRARGSAIRAHTVEYLDYYLQQFVENVRNAGGTVYFAKNAAEASAQVIKIAKDKKAKSIVKSKSMVSEEIHINKKLLNEKMEVVETDLGEYIIQLAEETPSHIIIPAIHKNRNQIKDLFNAAGGENLTTETKVLTAFARQTLREKFRNADIGITGCNFGIAESGTVTLFTNEGNADMVTNLPKTHIVLMGMERILPTFSDLEVMANLLPRSATGQKLTTYMSMITGAKRNDELDGSSELHLIILDNGRSRQLGDSQFQDVLKCIRCGACLNVCPVYRQVGGHSYGSVYPGPIGAVLSPLLNEGDKYSDLPFASSLCGACSEACPVQIPLHDMLVHLRQRAVENGYGSAAERMAFKGFARTFSSSKRYRAAMGTARVLQKPFVRNGVISSQIGPLSGWTKGRDAPSLAKQSFRNRWSSLKQELDTSGKGEWNRE